MNDNKIISNEEIEKWFVDMRKDANVQLIANPKCYFSKDEINTMVDNAIADIRNSIKDHDVIYEGPFVRLAVRAVMGRIGEMTRKTAIKYAGFAGDHIPCPKICSFNKGDGDVVTFKCGYIFDAGDTSIVDAWSTCPKCGGKIGVHRGS